jgi:hypothetical protein
MRRSRIGRSLTCSLIVKLGVQRFSYSVTEMWGRATLYANDVAMVMKL